MGRRQKCKWEGGLSELTSIMRELEPTGAWKSSACIAADLQLRHSHCAVQVQPRERLREPHQRLQLAHCHAVRRARVVQGV